MKRRNMLLVLAGLLAAAPLGAQTNQAMARLAKKESLVPVRPGIPGKVPFWNGYARRFIYAPAFDYREIPQADKYRYQVVSLKTGDTVSFENRVPWAALSPVWTKIPVGDFILRVTGIAADGDSAGLAGEGRYYHAAPFGGPYDPRILPYDSSAVLALKNLMEKDYVRYWLLHKTPDPHYTNYRYPAKIYSALIVGAVSYAELMPHTPEADTAIQIARIVADFLIGKSFPEGSPLAYFPPTYYGNKLNRNRKAPTKLSNYLTIEAPDAGQAYLDLYDVTRDPKYLQAAQRIAGTFLNIQLKNGSWYLFINHETGKQTAPNIAIPTAMIRFLDRLKGDYGMKGLKRPIRRAMHWIMQNPVKTFNWQGQFEDVYARPPYRNQSREQACNVAVYLFRHHQKMRLAEELVRYAEDQFVIWEQPRDFWIGKKNGPRKARHSLNWDTPCVQEQYVYWMPVTRSAGIMIDTYREAYAATRKPLYLAKAEALANSLEAVQHAHHGNYPSYLTPYPLDSWLNGAVYPARIMMHLGRSLEKEKAGI